MFKRVSLHLLLLLAALNNRLIRFAIEELLVECSEHDIACIMVEQN